MPPLVGPMKWVPNASAILGGRFDDGKRIPVQVIGIGKGQAVVTPPDDGPRNRKDGATRIQMGFEDPQPKGTASADR
jgi:hypothetical protein